MVGLEQELEAAKAALEPIRAQRESARGDINAQRERLDAIEVSFSQYEPEHVTHDLSHFPRNELPRQKGSANKPKRTNFIGSKNFNKSKTRSMRAMHELRSCKPNLRLLRLRICVNLLLTTSILQSWRQKALDYTEGEEREPDKGPEALQAELKAAEAALAKSSAR